VKSLLQLETYFSIHFLTETTDYNMVNDEVDLALRAPVPLSLLGGVDMEQHNARIRSSMSSLHVACHILQVSMETQFTASCLWHRLSLLLSQADSSTNHTYEQSQRPPENFLWAACIFVACKVEEDHRRLRDIVNCATMLEPKPCYKSDLYTYSKTASPCSTILLPFQQTPPRLEEGYWNSKEQMVTTEQYVLRWLAFDVVVSHPHRAVVIVMSELMEEGSLRSMLLSRAWKLVNESVWDVRLQGHSVMTLAAGIVTVVLEDYHLQPVSIPWWRNYAVNDTELHQVQQQLRQLVVPELSTATNTARQLQFNSNDPAQSLIRLIQN
jgi:hypothetical protein